VRLSNDFAIIADMSESSPRPSVLHLALLLGATLSLLPRYSNAANWQALAHPENASGFTYVDLDSIREEGGYRVALFLTIYADASANAHNIRLDRIAQKTAFDCTKQTFALLSTAGYLAGAQVGKSSDKADWRQTFKDVPQDPVSQRALRLVCNSPVDTQPEPDPASADSPGLVVLPAPTGGDVKTPPAAPSGH
jgi:hypothetical protein